MKQWRIFEDGKVMYLPLPNVPVLPCRWRHSGLWTLSYRNLKLVYSDADNLSATNVFLNKYGLQNRRHLANVLRESLS